MARDETRNDGMAQLLVRPVEEIEPSIGVFLLPISTVQCCSPFSFFPVTLEPVTEMSNNAVAGQVRSAGVKGVGRYPSRPNVQGPMNTSEIPSARFDQLWRRCVASPDSIAADEVQADLRRRLNGPDRRFHNLQHIAHCLRRLDEVASLLDDRDAVEVGLWFHDAVYTPSDPENERESANLFLAVSKGANPVFRRRVCGLILATRHKGLSHTNDRRFIEDIDLAGFGASWEEFMREGDLLREEFAAQADAQYYAGQVCFLAGLRQRPSFFATAYFREHYEIKAQENLRRLLDLRAEQGYLPAKKGVPAAKS
jgi:predicted metal-dependent HD superfamily phosphohydrolase